MAEKTHAPTPKRLRDARTKGDVPRSPLVAGAVGLSSSSCSSARQLIGLPSIFRHAIERLHRPTADAAAIGVDVVSLVAPIALALIGVAVVAGVATGGLVFSPARLAPDPSRLDPFGGLKPLDKTRAWGALRGLVLVIVLACVLGGALISAVRIAAGATYDVSSAILVAQNAATKIGVAAAVVALAAAVVDAVVGRRIWLSRLKMSREEVIREHKEGEGHLEDPAAPRRAPPRAARRRSHPRGARGDGGRRQPDPLCVRVAVHGEGADDEAPTLLARERARSPLG